MNSTKHEAGELARPTTRCPSTPATAGCLTSALLLGGVLACSAADAPQPSSHSEPASPTPNGPSTTGIAAGPPSGFIISSGGADSEQLLADEPSETAPDEACASTTQLARLTPVNLIILYDSSGSMGDSPSTGVSNMQRRWLPSKAGVLGFLADPGSPGIHAALKFFPHPGGFDATCNPDNYSVPDVALRDLENIAPFAQALDFQTPSGGTPMLPALMGAMNYAVRIIEGDPFAKTMVVMVTDGEPAVIPEGGATLEDVDPACPAGAPYPNTTAGVAEFVRSNYEGVPSIPTYVIGIGSSLTSLGQIAAAGGTELILIDDGDAERTQRAMSDALDGIRSRNFDCEIDFPELPDGEGVGTVNVDFVGSNRSVTEFEKATDRCSSIGWTLDDDFFPSKIQLCEEACAAVQSDPDGELQLAIGCATRLQRAR